MLYLLYIADADVQALSLPNVVISLLIYFFWGGVTFKKVFLNKTVFCLYDFTNYFTLGGKPEHHRLLRK